MSFTYKRFWIGWNDKRVCGIRPGLCRVFAYYGIALMGFQIVYSRRVRDISIETWNDICSRPEGK